jgi:hypothetical protein
MENNIIKMFVSIEMKGKNMRTNARSEREEKKLLKMWANSLLAADIISPTVFQIRSERKILQSLASGL